MKPLETSYNIKLVTNEHNTIIILCLEREC